MFLFFFSVVLGKKSAFWKYWKHPSTTTWKIERMNCAGCGESLNRRRDLKKKDGEGGHDRVGEVRLD